MNFIAMITLLLSTFALGQDNRVFRFTGDTTTLSSITWSVTVSPPTCISGPLKITWGPTAWIALSDSSAKICVYLRGRISFSFFANGIYAYNEFGEFVPMFTVRPEIREFNYGVH
jgi:hypothetical protein